MPYCKQHTNEYMPSYKSAVESSARESPDLVEAEAFLLNSNDFVSIEKHLHKYDKATLLKLLSKRPGLLSFLSDDQRDDEDLVTAAVSKAGMLLLYASQRLRHTKSVLLAAVKSDGYALSYALTDQALMSDPDIFMASAAKQGADFLKYASEQVRDNDDVIQECLTYCPFALLYASQRIQEAYGYNDQDVKIRTPYLISGNDHNVLLYFCEYNDLMSRAKVHNRKS